MLVLVKHAQPVLDPSVPPSGWRLGAEGEEQSRELASSLTRFLPFTLVASPEPKARRTAEIVAVHLDVPLRVVQGLEEFDRPAMPILSREEHQRINAAIFDDLSRTVLGRESGQQALDRFSAAIDAVRRDAPAGQTLVVVTHGTVIALYVAHVRGDNAFALWKDLGCGSFVVV